jgi:malate dehydrogenase (oxaloacetate-decarboxylating)(NADP+)
MKKNRGFKLPKGKELLHDPMLNKGSAFDRRERESLGLLGLLPPRINSIGNQVMRVMNNLRRKSSNLEKYLYLNALQERNKTLFYRTVLDHLEELMPIVYTPTVGQACLEYGQIFRSSSQGLFISSEYRGRVGEILKNWPYRDVKIIVVTDGERILGLGDLGVDGMGIPIGKLTLYTACAGIHPRHCLPVTIDVGTENEALLGDPFYIGMPHRRLRGKAYDELLEEFVTSARKIFPGVLIQFEDFGGGNAFALLEKYRDRACVFNDDIQGTAGVALAGLYSAMKLTGGLLKEQKILFMGAGEAGIGMGRLIMGAMVREGLSPKEALERCSFMDSKGLIVSSRRDLDEKKRAVAREGRGAGDCLEAVRLWKPTVLIGACGRQGVFTREVLEAMAEFNPRPVIFAMSNPTSLSECGAEEAYRFTQGRAIFASGSPFAPVTLNGKEFVPGQSNNAYVFPGVGLAVTACRIRRVSDEMFYAAARALAAQVTAEDLGLGRIYPPLKKIRAVSLAIAEAVAEVAYRGKLALLRRPARLMTYLKKQMYEPVYKRLV